MIGSGRVAGALLLSNERARTTSTESILAFPEPTTPGSTVYYCVVVTDNSSSTKAVVSNVVKVDISPSLIGPTVVGQHPGGGTATRPPRHLTLPTPLLLARAFGTQPS
jgi:hypothetical protein